METMIMTHADCDGICAGAIALSRFPKADVFFTKPVSLLRDLEETGASKVVVCDIALDKRDAPRIVEELKRFDEVLYFDHHPIPATIKKGDIPGMFVHDMRASASELIYRRYQKDIPRERVWVAIYGAIGDYTEDTPFVQERIRNWDRRALYFEVSSIVLGIKDDKFSGYNAKRRLVRTLSGGGNPSDVPGLVRAAKEAVNREFELYEVVKRKAEKRGSVGLVRDIPSFGFRGPAALFAATVTNSSIGMCANTRDNHIDITMRERERLPLNRFAEEAAEAVGGSGGGHPVAAGARIPVSKLENFLNTVNRMVPKSKK